MDEQLHIVPEGIEINDYFRELVLLAENKFKDIKTQKAFVVLSKDEASPDSEIGLIFKEAEEYELRNKITEYESMLAQISGFLNEGKRVINSSLMMRFNEVVRVYQNFNDL